MHVRGKYEGEGGGGGGQTNRHKRAIGNDDHIVVTITDEDSIRRLDDLREDFLDGIGAEIAFGFWTAIAAEEDRAFAFCPAD